jgi:hypothetical protein
MSGFDKIKGLVGALAPTLGTALGGPIGGTAAKIIADVLGCKSDVVSLDAAMRQATPEQLAEIKKAELEFTTKMKELDVDIFALETADKQDARKHFAKDWTPKVIALLTISGFLGYIFSVTFLPADENPPEIVNLILGWLGGTVSAIISFYFGASNTNDKTN